MSARLERGNAYSRLQSIGIDIAREDEEIAALVLDCMLRGVTRRPSILKIAGRLEFIFERRYGGSWEDRT